MKNVKTHRRPVFAAALCALVMAGSAVAGPSCPERPIRLAFYEYGSYYGSGAGLDKDVVDELQKRSNCRFEFSVRPRARIWKELEDGTLDMTTSGVQTPERKEIFWFLPYLQQRQYAVVTAQLPANIKTLEDFVNGPAELRLGIGRGFMHNAVYDAAFAKLAEQGRVQVVSDAGQLYRLLKAQRVAGLVAGPMMFRNKIQELKMDGEVKVADWSPGSPAVPVGMVLTKKNFSEAQAQGWAALFDEMKRDGTLQRLLGKYLSSQELQDSVIR